LSKQILLVLVFCGLGIAAASAQNYPRFNFNIGGGFGDGFGDVHRFTDRSYHGVAGGGLNLSRTFGIKAEYMYYNLAFKSSVIQQQSLPGASGNLQSATLNGVFTLPHHGRFGIYAIGGVGWYDRSVSAHSQPLSPGTICEPAWVWWQITCTNGVVTTQQTLSSHSVSSGGYNFGGGFTYRLKRRTNLYVEGRFHKSNSGGDSHTLVFPVTAGLRW